MSTDRSAEPFAPGNPELFKLLVAAVTDYAIFVLDPTGRIVTWNAGAERIKGYSARDILGSHFSRFYTARDVAAGKPEHALRTAIDEGHFLDEGWRLRSDGSTFWASVVITPLYDSPGQLRGFAKVTRDLTERRRHEQLERDARRNAEEANRLKDEFLATVSHELRTPLNVLTGIIWRLHNLELSPEEHRRAIGTLERNARLMTRLVEDLLDVSAIVTGKLTLDVRPVELGLVVQRALEAAMPAARAKNLTLQVSLSPAAGPILGDAMRLQQILWNLLSNAIKFTDAGGQVEVRLGRQGVEVVLQIRDSGRGIAAAFLPRIFERFSQADSTATREISGMGLGLAIVKHLAELHGGRVAAFSEGEGKGSTFEVYFPVPALLTPDDFAGTSVATLSEQLPQLVGIKVLVVDDQEDARESVCAVLKHCGANVLTAASTADALRIMDRFTPDILLADIAMPQDDGYALIRKVRNEMPPAVRGVPAAALTAYASTEDRLRVLAAGYQLHIPKPVDPAELIDMVAALAKSVKGGAESPLPS